MKTTESVERIDMGATMPAAAQLNESPALYKDLDAPLVALPIPQPVAETRYRLAAARLEAALDARGRGARRDARALGRLVLITSAEDGDGKTTSALHVATALSQAMGRRVALVEADTERPGLAAMLAVGQARGVTDILAGTAGLDDVLLRGADGGPLLVPAGSGGARLRRPANLLATLNALREYQDYVLCDCAALSRAADAAVLGRAADGVLLVVRVGSTSSVSLSSALEALIETPVIGCLLNDHDGPPRAVPTRGAPVESPSFDDEE